MSDTKYISIEQAAARLGLPVGWLRREAQAGRVPAIKAGRRILLDPQAVERALVERAQEAQPQAPGGGKGAAHE
jgi:excisionase family DNA binding protein